MEPPGNASNARAARAGSRGEHPAVQEASDATFLVAYAVFTLFACALLLGWLANWLRRRNRARLALYATNSAAAAFERDVAPPQPPEPTHVDVESAEKQTPRAVQFYAPGEALPFSIVVAAPTAPAVVSPPRPRHSIHGDE